MKYKVIRKVTDKECSWLSENIKKGTIVYEYSGCTYGCIGSGVAVTYIKDQTPFFELPVNSLKEIKER